MIIAINGILVDTTQIYKISDVIKSKDAYEFRIYFLNNNSLHIYLPAYSKIVSGIDTDYYMNDNIDENKFKNYNQIIKDIDKYLPICYKKVKEIHDVLIAYWSNNQTTIPQLNFE